jgi:hypothetical protein
MAGPQGMRRSRKCGEKTKVSGHHIAARAAQDETRVTVAPACNSARPAKLLWTKTPELNFLVP